MAVLASAYVPLQRNPTIVCITAMVAMGSSVEDSKTRGVNRLIGNLIGGFVGIALSYLEHKIFPDGNGYMKAFMVFIGSMLIVYLAVNFKCPSVVVLGVAILCIMVFNVPADNILRYQLSRLLDTMIGVAVAIFVNKYLDKSTLERLFSRKPKRDDG